MENIKADFSILTMSLASSAAMALGLAEHPDQKDHPKDKNLARFNIDLLVMLREKTNGNLTPDEKAFLESVIADLQMKYIKENPS